MSDNLTVGRTEFTPYNDNFDVGRYLNDLKQKMKKSDIEEFMAEVTLIYNRLGIISGVFINDIDLSLFCSDVEVKTMNSEAILHINMKKLKVINENE